MTAVRTLLETALTHSEDEVGDDAHIPTVEKRSGRTSTTPPGRARARRCGIGRDPGRSRRASRWQHPVLTAPGEASERRPEREGELEEASTTSRAVRTTAEVTRSLGLVRGRTGPQVSRRAPARPGAGSPRRRRRRPGSSAGSRRSSGPRSRRAAHWPQTVTLAPASRASRRSARGAPCGRASSSARPGDGHPRRVTGQPQADLGPGGERGRGDGQALVEALELLGAAGDLDDERPDGARGVGHGSS